MGMKLHYMRIRSKQKLKLIMDLINVISIVTTENYNDFDKGELGSGVEDENKIFSLIYYAFNFTPILRLPFIQLYRFYFIILKFLRIKLFFAPI